MNTGLAKCNGKLKPSWHLSPDAILFVVLWSAQLWSSELSGALIPTEESTILIPYLTRIWYYDPAPAFLLLALFAYILADLLLEGRKQFAVKLIALAIVIGAFVVLPTMAAIIFRHTTAPHLYIHDGAIQIEEAIKFLLAGKNPYVEDYTATPMGQWVFHEPGFDRNPSLDHLPYLPWTILVSLPFYLLSQATLGWYDQRFVYLLMFIALALMLLHAGRSPREQLAALMIVMLNPLFVPFFIEGRNDAAVLFWIVGAIVFLRRNQVGWAGAWLAFAVGSKQTAWFLIPFFALYVLRLTPASRRPVVERAKALAPGTFLLAMILIPFLLWNPAAFIDDTINYQSGISASAINYPIKSLGLGDLLLGLGFIKSSTDAFPFSVLQILFGGVTLAVLMWQQWRHNTIRQMTINYAILFLVFAFFSRTFNDNHLGFGLTWLMLPSFLAEADPISSR